MPKRVPAALIKDRERKDRHAKRIAAEKSMTPKSPIDKSMPRELEGHPEAKITWDRTIKLYSELDAQIVSALDRDHLVDYCLVAEEITEIEKDLQKNRKSIEQFEKQIPHLKKADVRNEALHFLHAARQRQIGLHGRLDCKRKLVTAMRRDLYLTPKTRAGVTPDRKPPKEDPDPMEGILDQNV